MIYITRRERFSSAHRLFNPEWSDEQNAILYGGCANPNWHGHNYILWVTIKGEINNELGYLADLKIVSKLINDKVISKLDHKNINLEVDFMMGKIISTENLAIGIWGELEPHFKKMGVELHSIRIEETENNFVEYFGK
jgi:6-pyruvoyltetrahydropterin/6-carboxytetrahydropterin synthase